MTWVKICGITNVEDARVAVEAGADALGFVFYSKSPRVVAVETVREIIARVPEPIEKVGVFADDETEQIQRVVADTGINAVQLHGTRSQQFVLGDARSASSPLSESKLIPVLPGDSLKGEALVHLPRRNKIFALMLDAQVNGITGGTGTTFDWQASREMVQMISLQLPVIVAGGLNPGNVAQAIRLLQPFGVDVSSGVEAKPGKKDPEKVRAFLQAVRAAEKVA
jgi:phosphoribosylanthranilate isomerase